MTGIWSVSPYEAVLVSNLASLNHNPRLHIALNLQILDHFFPLANRCCSIVKSSLISVSFYFLEPLYISGVADISMIAKYGYERPLLPKLYFKISTKNTVAPCYAAQQHPALKFLPHSKELHYNPYCSAPQTTLP